MAKIKHSELIANMRGSLGNHVFCGWKGTSYVRSKAQTRSNPRSEAQAQSRQRFSRFSQVWSSFLTDEQRALWDKFAVKQAGCELKRKERADIIAYKGYTTSGYNAFVQVNSLLSSVGLLTESAFRSTPPNCTENFPGPTVLECETSGHYSPYALVQTAGNQGYTAGNVLAFEYNQPFSGAMWIYIDTLSGLPRLMSTVPSPSPLTGWRFLIASGYLSLQIMRNFPAEVIAITIGQLMLYSTWYRVGFTYNGNNSYTGMKIYMNGVLFPPAFYLNTPLTGTININKPFMLLDEFTTIAPFFGYVDEAVLWNRELSPAEMLADYAGGAGLCYPAGGGIQALYHFDDVPPGELGDSSGNGYNLTKIGGGLPAVTPSPKSICAEAVGVQLSWNAPVAYESGAVVRIWTYSESAGVHKQMIDVVPIDEESYLVGNVRIAQGKTVPILSVPGEYLFQVDVIEPHGRQSAPSNVCRLVVPRAV